jgi:hypothetical protein
VGAPSVSESPENPGPGRAGSSPRLPARASTAPLPILVLLAAGCGGSLTSSGYSISGGVTWKGQPLDRGSIQFLPAAGAGGMVGVEIRDGRYALPNPPGLVPGTYRVRINSRAGDGAAPGGPPDAHLADPESKERIPPEYNERTTLRAEVAPGGTKTFDFDLDDRAAPR